MIKMHLMVCCLLCCLAGIARAAGPGIAWDSSTLRLIEAGADYPRMARLGNGKLACAFDRDRKMWLKISDDGAKTWSELILVAGEEGSWLTNASLLPLHDGSLLYFWNDRPMAAVRHEHRRAAPGVLSKPIRIRMARSRDDGLTWSAPVTLYRGGPTFQDGCWEPAGLQLPGTDHEPGEVQVYFSNEFPYQTTDEQEISLLRSFDSGKTWSKAERISMRKGHRDGMPAPLLLPDGKGIAVAIEDNGVSGGRFKPSIVFTSLGDNWRSGAVGGDSPNRWGALKAPLDPGWYAGAPCLAVLSGGRTLLSFQESADGRLEHCRMAVCIGDPLAKNFSGKTHPFPQDPSGNQAWNSLFVKDADTVIALSTATIHSRRGIWSIEGKPIRAQR